MLTVQALYITIMMASLFQSDADSDEIALSNHFYERGAKLESYVASLYSDWTDNFSTEVEWVIQNSITASNL